ncbi:MAG TPA: response regulator [Chryseosolibacter sp.]|nr:response regulator [Chryseosolibacter sp.]
MTILYIDDDPEDQEVFRDAVNIVAPHTTCYFARDGKEGFILLNKITSPPDYIFLDINMPEMSGKEFLHLIKKNTGLTTTPVIMYSTSNNMDDIREFKQLGAVDFIVKPNNFSGICDALKRFI